MTPVPKTKIGNTAQFWIGMTRYLELMRLDVALRYARVTSEMFLPLRSKAPYAIMEIFFSVERRHLQALLRRTNGIESILRPNVHSVFADCRSCVYVRVEFVDRQNFPIASSP